MLRFLADENFNNDIVSGLRLRQPTLDLIRMQDVGLLHQDDPRILAWAAAQDRILLTHDRATIPDQAFARVDRGEPMPGVFVLRRRLSIGRAIDELLLLDACTQQAEWQGVVAYLPL